MATRGKLALTLGFASAFAAGLSSGALLFRPPPGHDGPGWMASELHLSPAQRDRIEQIWSDVRKDADARADRWHTIQRDHDVAVRSFLNSDDERAKFEQAAKDRDARLDGLRGEMDQTVQQARERTRQVLNDEQRAKFDDLVRRHAPPPPPDVPMLVRPASTETPAPSPSK